MHWVAIVHEALKSLHRQDYLKQKEMLRIIHVLVDITFDYESILKWYINKLQNNNYFTTLLQTTLENTVEKWIIAHNEQFHLFLQCFLIYK